MQNWKTILSRLIYLPLALYCACAALPRRHDVDCHVHCAAAPYPRARETWRHHGPSDGWRKERWKGAVCGRLGIHADIGRGSLWRVRFLRWVSSAWQQYVCQFFSTQSEAGGPQGDPRVCGSQGCSRRWFEWADTWKSKEGGIDAPINVMPQDASLWPVYGSYLGRGLARKSVAHTGDSGSVTMM